MGVEDTVQISAVRQAYGYTAARYEPVLLPKDLSQIFGIECHAREAHEEGTEIRDLEKRIADASADCADAPDLFDPLNDPVWASLTLEERKEKLKEVMERLECDKKEKETQHSQGDDCSWACGLPKKPCRRCGLCIQQFPDVKTKLELESRTVAEQTLTKEREAREMRLKELKAMQGERDRQHQHQQTMVGLPSL